MDEKTLNQLFEQSSSKESNDFNMTNEERKKFTEAFKDPEFRKLFSEYMDEIQDPTSREETESYINQLESEQKVPQGKELIR